MEFIGYAIAVVVILVFAIGAYAVAKDAARKQIDQSK